ncbi:unnamed protein product, partial [Owenia fusiformis]
TSKNGALFIDQTFPADISSLTYVYSGDDKYERMVFKRPLEIDEDAQFNGIDGTMKVSLPWQQWNERFWLLYAITITSLNARFLEKAIPGYGSFRQSFQRDVYTGKFQFKIWRFGDWEDIIVDDQIPTLDDEPAYCPALGEYKEYWPSLLEKAYAKCFKAYEVLELGNPLNAVTDFTGAICEMFRIDQLKNEDLFHLLHKSCINRSMITCWRKISKPSQDGVEILATPSRVVPIVTKLSNQSGTDDNQRGHLHIITSAAKFPLKDGCVKHMLRIKNPYAKYVKLQSNFSDSNNCAWSNFDKDFMRKYDPLGSKDINECWMSLEDFYCQFDGIVLCSSTEPFKDGRYTQERRVRDTNTDLYETDSEGFGCVVEDNNRHFKGHYTIAQENPVSSRRENIQRLAHVKHCWTQRRQSSSDFTAVGHEHTAKRAVGAAHIPQMLRISMDDSMTNVCQTPPTPNKQCLSQGHSLSSFSFGGSAQNLLAKGESKHSVGSAQSVSHIFMSFTQSPKLQDQRDHNSDAAFNDLHSMEDTLNHTPQRRHSRPCLRPVKKEELSEKELKYKCNSTLFESRMDHFTSHGSWKQLLFHKGEWGNTDTPHECKMGRFERSCRILLTLSKPDEAPSGKTISPRVHSAKTHTIISLMQDYSQGSRIVNTFVSKIGFEVYRIHNPVKDEKKTLQKLHMVAEKTSQHEEREVTLRLNLDPGSYFIVPYIKGGSKKGRFLLRVLGDSDHSSSLVQNGCVIS